MTPTPKSLAERLADAAELSEGGNAERFIAQHGADWRWSVAAQAWLRWDGQRWASDERGEVRERARETIARLFDDARRRPEGTERTQLLRHALKSDSARAIGGMLELAKAPLAVLSSELDAAPSALNADNGIVDLRDGAMRPHDRAELQTKLAPVAYDPNARSAEWDKLLHDALGDDETITFLQRAIGYSATGDTREEKVFAVLGPAGGGKSTVVETVKLALGNYASTADFESFIARQDVGAPRQDIARLAGSRFVSSIEVENGRRLASGLVKNLSGGDTVTARFLYGREFEFRPTFKLWLVANDAPKVRHDDDGLWRRLIRIPFDRVVPPAQRDKRLKDRLREPEHLRAVLAWIVAGAVDWHANGLQVPKRIQDATEDYRAEMDPLRAFFEDRATLGPMFWTESGTLRRAFDAWCAETGAQAIRSGNAFASLLRGHGLVECRKHTGRGWAGVGLHQVDP